MTFSQPDETVARAERLVDAARELATESGSAAFTVAEVVGRAGSSLKGFYACFAGKDDLLLALLAEDSRVGATLVTEHVSVYDDPVDRLRAYVHGLFALVALPGALGYAGVLVREHRRLRAERPDELRAALEPLVGLLTAEIAAAVDEGRATTPDANRDGETIFELLLTGVHEVTLGRRDPLDAGADLWRLCWSGLRTTTIERTNVQGGP